MEDYCKDHMNLMTALARIEEKIIAIDSRINGSIDAIQKHIEEGSKYRLAIVTITVGLVVQIVFFANVWGRISMAGEKVEKRVDIISARVDKIIQDLNLVGRESYGYQDYVNGKKAKTDGK